MKADLSADELNQFDIMMFNVPENISCPIYALFSN